MTRTKIFISYSRKDKSYLDEIVPVLEIIPGIADKLWYDGKGIEIGDKFDENIKRALDETKVGVLLLSEHFLGSSYIRNHELPYLFKQAEIGALKLCLVFLTDIPYDAFTLTVDDGGGRTDISLLNYHGLNNPNQPLDKFKLSDRKPTYTGLANWISKKIRPPVTSSRRQLNQRFELAISIRSQNNQWNHRFSLPHASDFRIPQLNCPAFDAISDGDDGEALFQLLFGNKPEIYEAILGETFATGGSALPNRHPLRIRLITDDHRLYALPWSKIAFDGRPLREDGWTVEFHEPDHNGFPRFSDEICYFPGRVILCGSGDTTNATTAHLHDLRGLFQHRWPLSPVPEVVQSVSEFRNVLATGSTQFVYFSGKASREGLLLGNEENNTGSLSWAETAKLLGASRSVSLVFLNLIGEDSAELIRYGRTMLEGVKAAVLFQCSPKTATALARSVAADWVCVVLSANEERDPVQELHRYTSGCTAAWTRYAIWRAIAPKFIDNPDWVKILLDRRSQRAEILLAKKEFSNPFRLRRVYHTVVLGGMDCMVNEFPHTAGQHLRMNKDDKEVILFQSVFLTPSMNTIEKIDDRVQRQFRISARQPIVENIVKADTTVPNQFWYLVLGWRLKEPVTDIDGGKVLLKAISEWCRTRLISSPTPGKRSPNIRIISVLAIEAEPVDIIPELQAEMTGMATAFNDDEHFHVGELDPLSAVTNRDLSNYFKDHHICRCDDRYRSDFPGLLLAGRSEMPFSEAVATILRGGSHNWGNLFEELKTMHASGTWPPAKYEPSFWKPS